MQFLALTFKGISKNRRYLPLGGTLVPKLSFFRDALNNILKLSGNKFVEKFTPQGAVKLAMFPELRLSDNRQLSGEYKFSDIRIIF